MDPMMTDMEMMIPGSTALTSLDLFDPFDELDTLMGRDIDWINKPDFEPLHPRVQQKYRITVDCPGFLPLKNAIKTDVVGNQLIVTGHEEDKLPGGDFSTKQFKKTYDLPEGAEVDKMVSFMPVAGKLVVEIPLKERMSHMNQDLMPKIIQTDEGKAVSLCFGVPENIDPNKVHVSIKDRDLIVKADDVKKSADGTSKLHYYKRTTLPSNTDFDQLKVTVDDKHRMTCKAPLKTEVRSIKNVPISRQIC
jgi:HSP20 family molecular chaperone IbpA